MPDDFIPRRSGVSGPFQTRKIVGGVENGPFPNTPEESWLWLKERLSAGDNIDLQHDDENRQVIIHGLSGGVAEVLWGGIGGSLANQTDLQIALNGKAAASHTHLISQVTNLQSTLNNKAELSQVVRHDTTQVLNANNRLRAARNLGSLVTLSAELRGPSNAWQGQEFEEWLWTLPGSFWVWDFCFASYANDIQEDFGFEAIVLPAGADNESAIWSDQTSFSPGTRQVRFPLAIEAGGTGGLQLPGAEPINLRINSGTPYSGSISGLQFHARGIWVS